MEIKKMLSSINIKTNRTVLSDLLLLIGFIIVGTVGRVILVGYNLQPFPNFEIIMVLTFLAAMILRSTIAFFVPLFSMIFSDLLIGNPIFVGDQMNRIVLFTYSGFAIIALISMFTKNKLSKNLSEMKLKNIGVAAGIGIGFVLLYDVWTNIGWWYLLYPHTAESLSAVFVAGIPFMIYHLVSGVLTFTVIALPIVSYIYSENKITIPIKIKNIHKIPVVAVALCLIVLSFTGTAMKIPEKTEVWLENSDTTSVKIVIKADGYTIEDNIVASQEDTVYSILKECCSRNDISFKSTYYEEFDSVAIDSINNIVNGENGMYWQYYVNNGVTPPSIGCDKYKVSNGDYIEWRFDLFSY